MKNERKLLRENNIRSRYAFLIKGKDSALKSLIRIGKRWGVFRWVMVAFLFIFLFVFHASYNLLIQCKVHEKFARAIAYCMVLVTFFAAVSPTVFATDSYAVQPAAVYGGYETLTIDTSTLNGSTIYGSGDSEFGLDKDGGFYSSAWNSSGCLPDSGSITVGSVPYRFTWTGNAPYAGKDSIRLSSASPVNTTSKTMELKQYGVYDKIYVLGTAAGFANANSSLSFTVDLYYTDGTSSQTTYTLGDWYRDSAVNSNITLYTGLYRKDVNYSSSQPNGYLVNSHGPRLQSMAVECDETKLLRSIKFTMNTQTQTSGGTTYYLYSGIYAVTGKVSDSAPATPTLHAITDTDITSQSFTARWDSANNATKYYLDVATDASFANMLSGYNNMDVGNVTEYKVEGLTEGATYYYRVRSANNAGQSLSSTVRTAVPRFKNLPAPVLSYENTVIVGGTTHLQTVSWPAIENARSYGWSVEVTDESGVVSTYTGDLSQTESDGSAYVVTDGITYWLDITNLVDSVGAYKVSVVAEPVENSDEYLSGNAVFETVNIVYPDVTVDITDELQASGIVSGIGGDCEKSVTDGVITLTAKNANAYSELGTWYKSGEVFDTGVSTSLTADTQYVDTYKLIFDINRNKLELVDNGNGSYTLKLLEDIVLEQDLVFTEDIILDLNGKNITADTDAGFEVDDVILNIRNGQLTDATGGTGVIINTIANGAVIVENSAVMNGLVGGEVEVSWSESNGDKHYATMKDALTEGGSKAAEDNSTLSLLKDKEVTENATIPESITIHIPEGKELSVAENVTLTNEGSIVTDGAITNAGTIKNTEAANWKNEGVVANTTTGEIYNEGSLDNTSGQINNAGLFDGEGAIANENGVITSTEGILQNQISNGSNGQIVSEASWNEDGKKYYGPIDEAIESATNNTDEEVTITVEKNVSINENATIPEHVKLEIPADKTLTVPEGVVLDNNGEIVESGTLQVNGDLQTGASWTDGQTNHYASLGTALDKVGEGESVTLLEDITWTEDSSLEIPNDVDFVIPNDVVLQIEEEKLANAENIKSETSWKSDATANKVSFGSLKEAIRETASNQENNVDILVRDDVVVEENLEIPDNAKVIVPDDAALTIPENVVVENNGSMEVDGALNLEGTLATEATWKDGTTDFYGAFKEAMDAVGAEDSNVTDVTVMDNVVLGENTTIPEGTNLTINEGVNLTVPSGMELKNNGSLINNGTVTNNGSISNNSDIINEGLVEGNGPIANGGLSHIDTNEGIIKNIITDENGEPDDSMIESEAVITDSETGEKYYGSLEAVLENAESGDEVELKKDEVVLEKDVVVPEDVTLIIPEDTTVTVPEGTTLKNNGMVVNNSESGIIINEGSAINNGIIAGEGTIANNGGTLDLTEGVTANTVESTANSIVKSEAVWEIGGVVYRGSLEKALEAVSNNGGGTVSIDASELNIEESITIPEGVELVVPENTVVTLEDGVIIDNDGKIVSNGEIKTEGTGKIDTDASWTDENGKETYGSIEEALEAMQPDENGVSGVTDVTITGDNVTLPADSEEIVIPEGVKFEVKENANLVIPEAAELVNKGELIVGGEISGAGTIDNSAGTINMGNGAIKSEIAEGKEGTLKNIVFVETKTGSYYTTLEEALKDPKANKVTVLDNIELSESVEVSEKVTLVIPEDIVVTLGQDVVIENNGIIENSGHVDCGKGKIAGNPLENSETGTPDDLVVWKTDDQKTYYTTFENALEKVEEGDQIILTKDTVLTEDIVIPPSVTIEIPDDVELTIPQGVVLENNGMLENNGSISNAGVIDNMAGSAIGGEITGEGQINAETVWTNNGETYYGSIEDGIEDVKTTGGTITLKQENVVIDGEIVIPSNVTLEIPEGTKMTVAQSGSLVNDGTVKNDGEITNNGNITGDGTINNDNGTINSVNGVVSNVIENGENGKVIAEASWEVDGVTSYGSLEKAIETAQTQETGVIVINSNVVITDNMEIPEGVTLEIKQGVVVTVGEGASLINKGTIVNKGIIGTNGAFVNSGNIEGGGIVVDLTQNNNPPNNGTTGAGPSGDEPADNGQADDEQTDDEQADDEQADDGQADDEQAENGQTDDDASDDGVDADNDDVDSDIMPQEPEENVDSETKGTVENVIEEETLSDEEQEKEEALIKERDEAKKEAQITTTDVKYEEAKSENVTQDTNVSYGNGNVRIVIDTLDEQGYFNKGMYESIIISEVETVINACLSEEDKKNVEDGGAAQVRLIIRVSSPKVSSEDVATAEETVLQMKEENSGLNIAGHLDISVEKTIEGQNWKRVSKLSEEIEIKFEIPTEMQKKNAKYCVLRVHDGKTTLLEDLDNEENTITIRTNLFSTYSILYKAEDAGFNYMYILGAVLLVIVLGGVWLVRKRRKG